jgi:hypothetical protein
LESRCGGTIRNQRAGTAHDAGNLEQFPAGHVGLLPDRVAADVPGFAYAGKPVRFNPFEEKPAEQEEEPHEDRHHPVHADAMPGAPEDDLALDREHEEHEREDEAVVPVPEGGIILPERIDPGKTRAAPREQP